MENVISVMSRSELKYLMTAEQTDRVRRRLEGHMRVDGYGLTSIASIYYDTPDFRLIRASIENEQFKEKLRLRSYGTADDTSPVYLELKRKCCGVVYKRRVQSTVPQAARFVAGERDEGLDDQLHREIAAFLDHYETLAPACMIVYERVAYEEPEGDLRLTIDSAPRYRMEGLSLDRLDGTALLPEGYTILEVKAQAAVPLWLARILSEERVYKSRFSKYGEAYRRECFAAHKAI